MLIKFSLVGNFFHGAWCAVLGCCDSGDQDYSVLGKGIARALAVGEGAEASRYVSQFCWHFRAVTSLWSQCL